MHFLPSSLPHLRRYFLSFLFLVTCVTTSVFGTRTAFAAKRTVTTLLDDNSRGCLRRQIFLAAPGDTIDFSVTGTIRLRAAELAIYKDLSITGPTDGPGITINGDGSPGFGISEETTLSLSNLTITGGYMIGTLGGGINNGGNLTLSNCLITRNWAYHGAAIVNGGDLTILNTTISGNHATGRGGGIYNVNNGTVTLVNSDVSGNSANEQGGGGIWNDGGAVTATNSTFSRNSAHNGGAVYTTNGTVRAVNTTFFGNGAASIDTDRNGTGGFGGGVYSEDSTVTILNSTLSRNEAVENGGGIFQTRSTLQLANSIVAGNTAATGPDISGLVGAGDYNLVQNVSGATLAGKNNIIGRDPLLGDLAQNGGATQTMALSAQSPAFNQGSNSQIPDDLTTDGRGVGFARIVGGVVDIGAYESAEVVQSGPNFVVNKIDDSDDGNCTNTDCSLREAVTAANTRPNVSTQIPDTITFETKVFSSPQKIILNTGLPQLSDDVIITGPVAPLTLDGVDRLEKTITVFSVSHMVGAEFNDLTFINAGTGIYTLGTSRVTGCTFTSSGVGTNTHSVGTVTITNSTFSGNYPSGISNSGQATVVNCTLSDNSYGIYTEATGIVTVVNSTISNSAWGVYNEGIATLKNSLVVGNTYEPIGVTDGGGNITTGTATEAGLEVDASGKSVLRDNGGRTQTIAIVNAYGTAINAGNDALVSDRVTTDQRGVGFDRIKGKAVDIGAFELQSAALPAVTVDFPFAQDAVFSALPSNITGTYSDDLGATGSLENIKKLYGRLYRFNGRIREFWNSSIGAWQTTAVRLPALPLRDGTWRSTPNLPRNTDDKTDLPGGTYGLTIVAVDTSGNVGSVALRFRILPTPQDQTAPVLTISNIMEGATYTRLPTSFEGTVSDNNGVFNIRDVTLRLRRFRSTPSGVIREHWNPQDRTWQTALAKLDTNPLRPQPGSVWKSTSPLPSATDLIDGTYCLTALARDSSNNPGSTWVYFRIASSVSSKVETSVVALSSIVARSDETITLIFTGSVDESAVDPVGYDVVKDGTQTELQSVEMGDRATTVVLRAEGISKGDLLGVAYNIKDIQGRALSGVAKTTVK